MDMAAPTAMHIDGLLTLAQWLSPSFPVGAYSYSHGLEWVVAAGDVTDADSFADWLNAVMEHGGGRNDALLLKAAYEGDPEAAALARALAPSPERRLETEAQGAAFASTSAAIWNTPADPAPYPVAVGRAAGARALPLEPVLALYLQAFAANLTFAATRLVPLGQTEGQAVLARAAPLCARLAQEVLDQDLDDLGGCTFAADIASMRHETLETRIFRT